MNVEWSVSRATEHGEPLGYKLIAPDVLPYLVLLTNAGPDGWYIDVMWGDYRRATTLADSLDAAKTRALRLLRDVVEDDHRRAEGVLARLASVLT